MRDEPVATPHFGHDEICGATGIKTRRAALRDPLQRTCQLRLFESTITDFAEVLGEIRFAGVIGKRLGHAVDQGLRGDEAVARQSNGGLQQFRPGSTAVFAMRFPESGDRSRHARSAMSDQRRTRDGFASRIEIHVAARRLWGDFAEVEKGGRRSHLERDEATAAEITRFRKSHGEYESGRDGGIDGVAAASHYGLGDLGAVAVGSGDRRSLNGGLGRGGLGRGGE